jgi:5-methylcytosine-specific restriction endonuclease McrA
MGRKTRRRRRSDLLARDGNRCRWCDVPFTSGNPPTMDHIVALKDGGTDRLDNLVLACAQCNNDRANAPWRLPRLVKLAIKMYVPSSNELPGMRSSAAE